MSAITTVFSVSGIALALLLTIKYAEIVTGRRLAERARQKCDAAALVIGWFIMRKVPAVVQHTLHYVAIHTTHQVTLLLWRMSRFLERRLYRVVNAIRGRKEIHKRSAPRSQLLQTVAHMRMNRRQEAGDENTTPE